MHSATRVIQRIGVIALAAVMSVVTLQVPASAKPDRGLCSYTETRGKIPNNFPIPACFDGQYLVVVNTMEFPIVITASGSGKPVWARMNGSSAASHALAIMFVKNLDLLPPKYKARIPIGSGVSKVKLGRAPDRIHKTYVFMEGFWRYVPFGPAEAPKAAFDLIAELVQVGDEYVTCMRRSNVWGDLGCNALLVRNVTFAVGRALVNVASGGLVHWVLSFFDSQKWALTSIGDNKDLKASGEFTIAAAPVPPPPVDNGGNSGGNTGGGSGNNPKPPPPAAPQPPPPAAPQPPPAAPSTAVITVQNKHVELSDRLVEDSTPAYLSTVMEPRCKSKGCALPGTDMWSGYQLTARCWADGAWMTNENLNTSADDNNPYKWSSTRWYRGVWPDGREGWISEIYIVPEHRGGAGLPHC